MSDLVRLEEVVESYLKQGNVKKAIQGLLFLITEYAQQDLQKAEVLREKIVAIDPAALAEVIRAQEIIDSARSKPTSKGHLVTWSKMYAKLTEEETAALQNEMQEVVFQPGQTIFTQGQKNQNLYFIDAGQAKHLYTKENREIFINRITAGNVANVDSFFDAGLCTCTLVAIDQVKVHFLPAITLLSWEGYLPTIEPQLRDICAQEEKISNLLQKSAQDRRIQRRIQLPGRILLKVVDAKGEVVGKTIRGDISDVSIGGVSFYVHTTNREQAQMLLGHNLYLRFNMPPVMTEVKQVGKVLGVKHQAAGSDSKEKYSVHVKFSKVLPESSIAEAERFLKMLKIAEKNR